MAGKGDGVWQYAPGRWAFALRLDTSEGRRLLKRGGFQRAADAKETKKRVESLVGLVKPNDPRRKMLGDLIFACQVRDGRLDLPDVEETRRRIGARVDLSAPSMSTGSGWTAGWQAAGRSRRRPARATPVASSGTCGRTWATCPWTS